MWEAISKNRWRSRMLISLMGLLLAMLGFSIGMLVEPEWGGPMGALTAVGIWLVMLLGAYAGGDHSLLASASAAEIIKEQAPQLWNIVEEMTIASGLERMPRIYIIDSSTPNAFAVGLRKHSTAIAVTSGLLKRLNRDELQGVVAHEIGHIVNQDTRFMTMAAVLLGSMAMISHVFLRVMFYGGGRGRSASRSSGGKGAGQAQAIALVVALVLAVLAPLLARILFFACSRKREYLADASAALFTRYPAGLAAALEKIGKGRQLISREVNQAIAPLYIVNPLQPAASTNIFSTHPPTNTRVLILRSMAGAGLADYEAAYEMATSRRCLEPGTLSRTEPVALREPSPEASAESETLDSILTGPAREAIDLLDGAASFFVLSCACGLRIKVPPELKTQSVHCPRCGADHALPLLMPGMAALPTGHAQESPTKPFAYQRKKEGWESFECPCGKVMQLSPSFSSPFIKCAGCNRQIKIVPRNKGE